MRSQVVIVATLILNGALFALNLYVALLSGSRAVLAQAIYSVTDLAGGVLLLWGLYASQLPADYRHPFGRGKERFYWALISIVVTFTIAGLLALSTGVDQWLSPAKVTHIGLALIVIGATLLVSAISIAVTLREIRRAQQTLQSFLESRRIGLKSVFYQDVVSIVGCLVAFFALIIVYRTGHDAVDGAAAFIEGVLLIITGLVLTVESHGLLIGQALDPEEARAILGVVERDSRVQKVRALQSMVLGPDDALLAIRINFRDGLTTDQIESAVDDVRLALQQSHPVLRHVIIEPES
ncbi:MAG TPA: cation diffusion facilitator family transporter [Thermoplasmata archaeon]|jgi:cation diffusion facilitator family transporter|nr:cation diffusion facilitator family transporter [Thermoplasmata archaeon]